MVSTKRARDSPAEEASSGSAPRSSPSPAAAESSADATKAAESLTQQIEQMDSVQDSSEAALPSQYRLLQQLVLRQLSARSPQLTHPRLWPALLERLRALQPHTVRIDVHVLSAVGRTVEHLFAEAATGGAAAAVSEEDEDSISGPFGLLRPLRELLRRLLPAEDMPVSESWSGSFHPNYELVSAMVRGVLKQVREAQSKGQWSSLPPVVWQFVSTLMAAFRLISLQQTSQRKVYEHVLSHHNLPVWASLHRAIRNEVRRAQAEEDAHAPTSRSADGEEESPSPLQHRLSSMRTFASSLEHLISSTLFHPEHLNLYPDALGVVATAQEDEEEDEEPAEKKEAKKENEGEEEADGKADEEESPEPASKRAKVNSNRKGAKESAGPKPATANNYTQKLFTAVEGWIREEQQEGQAKDKKRKVKEEEGEKQQSTSTALAFTSRDIRSLLPLLFSGYIQASTAQFQSLYPSSVQIPLDGAAVGTVVEREVVLTGLDLRRKKVREKQKTDQELTFLQKMWSINEMTGEQGSGTSNNAASTLAPIYSSPLTSSTLPLLHSIFSTNASLFRLIDQYDIYQINQDANVSAHAASVFTGFKKVLAEQMDKVMTVAKNIIEMSTSKQEESSGKKKRKSVAPPTDASSPISASLSSLLSLCVPLSSNMLHLLNLNPEFVGRYLYVRQQAINPSMFTDEQAPWRKSSVWHFVWKVRQMVEQRGEQGEEAAASDSTSLSPPSLALPSILTLSQSLFLNFSKLRQYDVLFNSYMVAARSVSSLGGAGSSLSIAPFATVNGPRFQLATLLRNIPPLKVPNLWEWFLTQCSMHLDSTQSVEGVTPASTAALLHFFVFFLDTMLVREEIAVQLQAMYTQSVQQLIAKPLRSMLKQGASEGDAMETEESNGSSSSLPVSSLLLLLHSLNDVKAQCDQHTTKTYETMMQALPPYFQPIEEAQTGEGAVATQSASIRLTDVLKTLKTRASTSPSLLYSLRLLATQRLHQLYRFLTNNVVTNLFEDADEDGEGDVVMDSSDEEETPKKQQSGNKRTKQTHQEEAQALTAFMIQQVGSCNCSAAADASEHALFQWDGTAASLPAAPSATSAVALWHLVTSHLDVLAYFATEEQRTVMVRTLLSISACPYCQAQTVANDERVSAPSVTAPSSALHTPGSLTTSLLTQPWFYEIVSLRSVLLDEVASTLTDRAFNMFKALDKSFRKSVSSTKAEVVKVPEEMRLTTGKEGDINTLLQLAGHVSAQTTLPMVSSDEVSARGVWECVWLLQLLHSFPSQYVDATPRFHSLMAQLAWALECVGSLLAGPTNKEDKQPLTLPQLAAASSTADKPSLYSHLLLSTRRLILLSLRSLTSSPSSSSTSSLPSVLTPSFLEWVWGSSLKTGTLKGRHVHLAREATKEGMRRVAPSMLAGKKKAKAAPSALLPLVERMCKVLSSSRSSPSDLSWHVSLSSALSESFVSKWSVKPYGGSGSAAAVVDGVCKSYKSLVREAPAISELLTQILQATNDKLIKRVVKEEEVPTGVEAELQGGVFSMCAHLLVNLLASRSGNDKEATPLDDKLLSQVDALLSRVIAIWAESSPAAPLSLRSGALTFLHSLCVMWPLLQQNSSGAALRFDQLLQALYGVMCSDAAQRLSKGVHAPSPSTAVIQAAFASLMSHSDAAQCHQMVDLCLEQLDPSFLYNQASSEEITLADPKATYVRVSAALQLLQVYVLHTHTLAQKRALTHTHLSLLFYRLSVLSSLCSQEYLSRSPLSSACVSLCSSSLLLLVHVLSRHQLFSLDDQMLSIVSTLLNHVATIMKDAVDKRKRVQIGTKGEAAASAGALNGVALYHPLYLALYALLKFHSLSLIKIVPLFLLLLRSLMEVQWRSVQQQDVRSGKGVPLSISENLGRLLEEVGRPANAKLFNKYMVGLLLEWITISKHKGSSWGQPQQEAHIRAVHKGLFALIHICEEHDLSQLHTMLDQTGRTIFRTLHQAYKKTKFTGLV